MGRRKRKPTPDELAAPRSAGDHWRDSLEKNFSIFGQLVYLGSLRDAGTRVFVHAGLELRCGKRRAHSLIGNEYARIMEIWLGYDRVQQEAEIRAYFRFFEIKRKASGYGHRS